MRLPPEETRRVIALMKEILAYAAARLDAPRGIRRSAPWRPPERAGRLRDAFWGNPALIAGFEKERVPRLDHAARELFAAWREHRVRATFVVLKHLKCGAVLLGEQEPARGYLVLGLQDTIEDLVPFTPCIADMVLLPCGDTITHDGFVAPHRILIGPGMRRDLLDGYRELRTSGRMVARLPAGRVAEPVHVA